MSHRDPSVNAGRESAELLGISWNIVQAGAAADVPGVLGSKLEGFVGIDVGEDDAFFVPDFCEKPAIGVGDVASAGTHLAGFVGAAAAGGGDDHRVSAGKVFDLRMSAAAAVVHPEENGASEISVGAGHL